MLVFGLSNNKNNFDWYLVIIFAKSTCLFRYAISIVFIAIKLVLLELFLVRKCIFKIQKLTG